VFKGKKVQNFLLEVLVVMRFAISIILIIISTVIVFKQLRYIDAKALGAIENTLLQ